MIDKQKVENDIQNLFNEMSTDSRWELSNLRLPLIEMKVRPVFEGNGIRWKGWGWLNNGDLKLIGDYSDTQLRVYLYIGSGMSIRQWIWDDEWRKSLVPEYGK